MSFICSNHVVPLLFSFIFRVKVTKSKFGSNHFYHITITYWGHRNIHLMFLWYFESQFKFCISQNQMMVEIEQDLWGQLEQPLWSSRIRLSQNHDQMASEYLQGQRFHSLYGQHVPGLSYLFTVYTLFTPYLQFIMQVRYRNQWDKSSSKVLECILF